MGNNKTTVEQPGSATAWLDLETVIRQLHASDLRVGVQASDAGIPVAPAASREVANAMPR